MILLSSSVSLPDRSSSTCLPVEFAASRTARDNREYKVPIGTMRAAVISSCKWCASFVNSSMSPSTRPMKPPICDNTSFTSAEISVMELDDLTLQAFLRKAEGIAQTLEFRHATEHAGAVDDQLANRIHHAIEARQGDSNRFGSRRSRGPFVGFCRDSRSRRRSLRRARFRSRRCTVRSRNFFFIHRRNFGDSVEQRIDASTHLSFVGPLLVQDLFQNIHGLETKIDDLRRRFQFIFA